MLTRKVVLFSRRQFLPALLFAFGVDGAWYDPSDLSTMFSDAAGTTPAVIDGLVRRINDKSGRGHHRTAASDAASPILRSAGSLYWLEHDGVDDILTASNAFQVVLPFYIAEVISTSATTPPISFTMAIDATDFFRLSGTTSSRAVVNLRGPASANSNAITSGANAIPVSTVKVRDSLAAGAILDQRVNLAAAGAPIAIVQTDGTDLGLASISNNAIGAFNFYGGIALKGHPGVNRDAIVRWLGRKGGLSL